MVSVNTLPARSASKRVMLLKVLSAQATILIIGFKLIVGDQVRLC